MGEHGEVVRSVRRSAGDYPPDRPPRSPAHHAEGGNHRVRLAGDRSVIFISTGSRPFRSHHLPCFPDCPVGKMTPLACRDASAPAAAPARSSHTASRNVRCCWSGPCITLSDSLARHTGGSDSPLMRLVTFAPLSRCLLGPLGPGPAARFAPPALERDGQSQR